MAVVAAARVARAEDVLAGSVLHGARLISMVENGHPDARTVLSQLRHRLDRAQIVGLTGPPGAGKSSLTASLIRQFRDTGRSVGVIAVDPSSPFTGGALLGDRDRMLEAGAGDPEVLIRSLASRGAQGGLAAAVNDAVDVLDAMGKDVIVIETVGVGQGELEIAKIAHTVVLVFVPGYGDALQAMKAGITEIADVVAVNKADLPGAQDAYRDLRAQGYQRRYPAVSEPWDVPITQTSALRHEGIAELVEVIDRHYAMASSTGWRETRGRQRRREQFRAFVEDEVRRRVLQNADAYLADHALDDPFAAATQYVDELTKAHTRINRGDAAQLEGNIDDHH